MLYVQWWTFVLNLVGAIIFRLVRQYRENQFSMRALAVDCWRNKGNEVASLLFRSRRKLGTIYNNRSSILDTRNTIESSSNWMCTDCLTSLCVCVCVSIHASIHAPGRDEPRIPGQRFLPKSADSFLNVDSQFIIILWNMYAPRWYTRKEYIVAIAPAGWGPRGA